MRAHLGLDKPLAAQYGLFLRQALQGDLGESIRYRRPVTDVLASRFPASLQLGSLAIVISLLIALPIGVYSAVNRGTAFDLAGGSWPCWGSPCPCSGWASC